MTAKKTSRRKSNGGYEPRLYPYQQRWVGDDSRYKIACKARQIGFSFAAAWRVVDKRLERPGLTVWLSASERQALEGMEHIRRFCRELKVATVHEESFVEGTLVKQLQVRFPNGSRIVALPANPDTVRGFAGDIVLDEFAFHRDDEAIWRAAFATATRGYQIEIISTPNGARGKYYELARAAGLVDYTPVRVEAERGETRQGFLPRLRSGQAHAPSQVALSRSTSPAGFPSIGSGSPLRSEKAGPDTEAERPTTNPIERASSPLPAALTSHGIWSPHWVSLAHSRAEGFVVDVESLRAAISDEDAWQQEYCCRFLTDAAHFIPPEMVVAAEHPNATLRVALGEPAATTSLPLPAIRHQRSAISAERKNAPAGNCFLGVDIGRRRDLTVLWLLEVENPEAPADARRYVTRSVQALDRRPFAEQRRAIEAMLALPQVARCAVDASGLGLMLAEELQARWGGRVEPVTFTAAVKEDLAVRVKRMLEERRLLLPYDPVIRASLGAVKRFVTPAGNVRFDAERTDAGHADHFWALALALAAADDAGPSVDFVSTESARSFAQAMAF